MSEKEGAPKGIDAAAIVKSVFGDKYTTDSYVGRGAQAYVWKVIRNSDKKVGVAKIVIKKPEKDETGKKSEPTHHNSQSEFDCLKLAEHFAIVAVLDMCLSDRYEVVILEYIDSGDLMALMRDYVKNNPGRLLSEKGIGQIFIQLAMALFHLHHVRILHRDIKSSNILLTSTGLAKVSDFGFSRRYDDTVSNDVSATPLGTPYYIAPELWRRRKYNSKADVFSMGIVLYELMCLRRPFAGHALRDLMDQILKGVYEPAPDCFSPELRNLLASMLKVNPLERPTMAEILDTKVMRGFADEFLQSISQPKEGSSFAKIPEKERQQIIADIKKTQQEVKDQLAKHAVPTLPPGGAPSGDAGNPPSTSPNSATPTTATSSSSSSSTASTTTTTTTTATSGGSPNAKVVAASVGGIFTPGADGVFVEGPVSLAGDSEWKSRYVIVKNTELVFKRTKSSGHSQSIPLGSVQRASLATAPGSPIQDDVVVVTLIQQNVSQTFFIRPTVGDGNLPAKIWLERICDAHNAFLRNQVGMGEDDKDSEEFQ